MTGLNVAKSQAFYCERPAYANALSTSFNYCFENGATMTLSFVAAGRVRKMNRGLLFSMKVDASKFTDTIGLW